MITSHTGAITNSVEKFLRRGFAQNVLCSNCLPNIADNVGGATI